ncbi:MAG: hypothetical protein IKT99_05000, partial [Oscillospiraceae bacterium]|nr:hypothetical protein [Oscillospiraceae bacterium]
LLFIYIVRISPCEQFAVIYFNENTSICKGGFLHIRYFSRDFFGAIKNLSLFPFSEGKTACSTPGGHAIIAPEVSV